MFNDLKKQLSINFSQMARHPLFCVDVARDEVWQAYLAGFRDDTIRQEHNCNCCKSFLRQFAGIVNVTDNKIISIWDGLTPPPEFAQAVKNLSDYAHSRPITDVFLSKLPNCGTDRNRDLKRSRAASKARAPQGVTPEEGRRGVQPAQYG